MFNDAKYQTASSLAEYILSEQSEYEGSDHLLVQIMPLSGRSQAGLLIFQLRKCTLPNDFLTLNFYKYKKCTQTTQLCFTSENKEKCSGFNNKKYTFLLYFSQFCHNTK